MNEEATHDSISETIITNNIERTMEDTKINAVTRLPCHISDESHLNNDKLITRLNDSNVECLQEPCKKWQHARSEDDQVQSHNQSQSECITSNSVAADRALELFSEALMSDSDTECDLNISVALEDKDNDTLTTEKNLLTLTDRRVHFADELVVDTECVHDIHHPHAQSSVCVRYAVLE